MTTDPNLRTFTVTMNAKTCDRQDYVARDLADVIIGEHLFADVEVTEAEPAPTEREIRARIAADLRRAAEGRREYAGAYAEKGRDAVARDQLLCAADAFESAALVVEDPLRLRGLIPSWRWTAEEHAAVTPEG